MNIEQSNPMSNAVLVGCFSMEKTMITRDQAVKFLITKPYKFGHMLGFTKLTELHNKWIIDMVRGKIDKSLAASRGTYKTTCVSIALSLIIILLPRLRTMFMRKTDSDVKEIMKQVANILKDPHTLYFVQVIYGVNLRLVVESVSEVSTNLTADIKGTSQLVGIGAGASITGKHFDRVFTDDIINIKDRISHAEREQTKIIYQELQNVKNRDGRIYNTLTIWHKDDASALMPNMQKYDCYNEEIRDIISAEDLEHIKNSMTASLFACNYELKIIADENLLFDERPIDGNIEYIRDAICHVDCAYGGEDYTAFTAMAYVDGHFYVYGKCWQKHVENCYNEIKDIYFLHQLSKCFMEDNGDKGFAAKDMKRKLGMRAMSYHESTNKHIKISTYLKAIWSQVVFVEGTDPEYINQIYDYNEEAEHDDCADSCACLARRLYKKSNIKINIDLGDTNMKEREV